MASKLTLDRIGVNEEFDLISMYNNANDTEDSDSPFKSNSSNYSYYELWAARLPAVHSHRHIEGSDISIPFKLPRSLRQLGFISWVHLQFKMFYFFCWCHRHQWYLSVQKWCTSSINWILQYYFTTSRGRPRGGASVYLFHIFLNQILSK